MRRRLRSSCRRGSPSAAWPRRRSGRRRSRRRSSAGRSRARASVERAAAAFAEDFSPLSDARASAGYRLQLARNLLLRVFLEASAPGAAVRLSHGQR